MVGEAQQEYINHLTFLLSPVIEKLPEDVAAQIRAIPGECGVKVEIKARHVIGVVLPPRAGKETQVDSIEQGQL